MKETESQAVMVVGLGFGDEGKGGMVDFLSRELPVHTVVRFNGGVQAAHSVYTPDGIVYSVILRLRELYTLKLIFPVLCWLIR